MTDHVRRLPGTLLLTLAVAACGGSDEAEPDELAAVDTVGGVERLRYPEGPLALRDWSTDTLAVIGDAFADDAYQFNDVSRSGLAADADGDLYVLDRQGGRVLKYGRDGAHLATYGRKGEGPGELSQPLGLALGPGDTVWVSDFSNSRLTGYPQDGGEPRTIPFPENAGIPSQDMAAQGDGFVLMFRPLFNFGRGAGGGLRMSRGGGDEDEDAGPPLLPVMRYGPSLEPGDTLWTSVEPPMDMVQLEAAGRVMITMMSREFYPDFQWGVLSDGGIVVSDSAAYALHLIDPDGTMRRTITRDPAPRVVTEADREAARERTREQSRNESGVRIGGGGPDDETRDRILQQRLEKMTFADLVPRVVGLRVDPRDRIWVGVSEATADSISRIDVYDRDGRLMAELRDFPMPDVFLDDDRIGVLRRDELDVQQVVVLGLGERELASQE